MRREQSIATIVYNHLFPSPTPSDPPDFASHLAKNLVAEVRIETQRFYGGLETVEARYPGLNYSHPPHRKRLGRFPHHARLFKAFDELGLTEHEISMLCRWEGTLWARQRYERDEGIKVVDTTGMEIGPYVDRRRVQKRSRRSSPRGIKVKTHIEVEIEDAAGSGEARSQTSTPNPPSQARPTTHYAPALSRNVDMPDAVSSRQATPSASENEAPATARLLMLRIPAGTPLPEIARDPAMEQYLEQYLKEQAERGGTHLSPEDLRAHIRAMVLNAAMQNGGPTASASSVVPAMPDSMQQTHPQSSTC
ncbi:uncharacterized protein PV09_00732 [Verruconis gallopava]|uniref:Uncharacterized protein n=1 Tax=Verruconis gallopava TaxID=253628 RepID=A0A0D2AQ25_9PEZI|nr:uncharacterized protein PV09_00732 [Verruconis gallopava]KIW08798.1 hypothetical protein PV09_00732 [Verruconis gallopava]